MMNKRIPSDIKKSYLLWLVAIGAGVFEMAIAVTQMLSSGSEAGFGIMIQVGIRSLIFAALVYVIVKMQRGKRWARIALTVLLGGIGTVSLLVDPIQWLLEGNSLDTAFTGMTVFSSLFGISRFVHLASVIAAIIFMYRPAANQYFNPVASHS